MTRNPEAVAQSNFSALSHNTYPGRGIVVGLDETSEHLVQVYWIMGRSEKSRNRVFKKEPNTERVYTEAADPTKLDGDPSLIIYNAMREGGGSFVVSNGSQTDTVAESHPRLLLNHVLLLCTYEPDAPNYTQRITAVSSLHKNRPPIQMSILRKSVFGDGCDRLFYEYDLPHRGFGYCITTYAGDGDPLPPFCGDPLIMPLRAGIVHVAHAYWHALNEANRVSLAVKFIHRGTARSTIEIINRYEQKG